MITCRDDLRIFTRFPRVSTRLVHRPGEACITPALSTQHDRSGTSHRMRQWDRKGPRPGDAFPSPWGWPTGLQSLCYWFQVRLICEKLGSGNEYILVTAACSVLIIVTLIPNYSEFRNVAICFAAQFSKTALYRGNQPKSPPSSSPTILSFGCKVYLEKQRKPWPTDNQNRKMMLLLNCFLVHNAWRGQLLDMVKDLCWAQTFLKAFRWSEGIPSGDWVLGEDLTSHTMQIRCSKRSWGRRALSFGAGCHQTRKY